MGKVVAFDKDRALRPQTALEKIRRFWLDGCYVPCPYAMERMSQRHIDDHDIAFLIFDSGHVASHNKVDGLWRYKVSGKSVEGKRIAAIFEFQGSLMTLVTVHDRVTTRVGPRRE